MGRRRKGPMDQSQRKPKVSKIKRPRKGVLTSYFNESKSKEQKLFLQEEAIEIVKNMNPQQLVNFLLPNDDWHIKDSTVNASAS